MARLAALSFVGRQWTIAWKSRMHYGFRAAYAGLLLVSLIAYFVAFGMISEATTSRLADVARSFFHVFARVQFFLVTFLAVVIFSRAIIREREGNTLDLLVVSPAGRFELLFGMVLGDLLGFLTLLLAGLPVLAFMTLFGGLTFGEVLSTQLILMAQVTLTAAVGLLLALISRTTFEVFWLMVVGLVQERLTPDTLVFGALVVLMIAGVLEPTEALGGFASPTLFTVLALFIVAGALRDIQNYKKLSTAIFL